MPRLRTPSPQVRILRSKIERLDEQIQSVEERMARACASDAARMRIGVRNLESRRGELRGRLALAQADEP